MVLRRIFGVITIFLCLIITFLFCGKKNEHSPEITDIQRQLDSAATNGREDTIRIPAGTYNVGTTLTYHSEEAYALYIIGAGMNQTILDGQDEVQIMNLSTVGLNADLYVKNITFQEGHSNGYGGGLRAESDQGLIRIDSCEFIQNTADTLGGGAHIISAYGTATVGDCIFRGNQEIDDAGGLNAAADGGGGIMNYLLGTGVSLTISNNTFSNNRAQLDGGGCFVRINDSGDITFNNNTFSGNTTISAGGAGTMIHLNEGNLEYSGNTYTSNNSAEDGGGLWIWNGNGTLNITGNTYTNNQATINGGGAMISTDQGTVNCTRNIFSGNSAGNVGGDLSYSTNNGQMNFAHNTFYGNQAGDGGGVCLYFDQASAQTTMLNSIFWHDNPNELSMSGATTTIVTYSDIENGTGQPWFGTGCIALNPQFVNASDGDFHLTSTSPCIDTGDPSSPNDPDGTRADMGALYYQH
uniref:Right-handed parallel beta-helix repeat-containing protein n=1 Tax=candidate division WOR-3 bacterium TaxID=2052148 RepID=A0A7V0Z7U4_UNCW3